MASSKSITDRFEIYRSQNNVVIITNGTAIAAMHELDDKGKTLAELSRSMEIPATTLLMHLCRMVNEGLVATFADPIDYRKVRYMRCADLLISPSETDPSIDRNAVDVLRPIDPPGRTCFEHMVAYLACRGESNGLPLTNLFADMGRDLAKVSSDRLSADNMDGVIDRMTEFMESMGFGRMSLVTHLPLTFRVDGCMKGMLPQHVAARFIESFVSTTISEYINERYVATCIELGPPGECPYHIFKISPAP